MIREERLEEQGLVLEALPGMPRRYRVQLQAGPACEECSARVLCLPEDGDRRVLEASSELEGLQPGDLVRVQVDGSRVLQASLLLYGVPLASFLLGLLLGWPLLAGPHRELLAFAAGALAASLAWFGLRPWMQRREAGLLAARICGRALSSS